MAAAVILAVPVLTAACAATTPPAPPGPAAAGATALAAPGTTLAETGSSLLYPLMHAWAQAYQGQTAGLSVTTASTSSGTGIAAAAAGTADIGASDAYLSRGDLVKSPQLVNIPLAVSAQTVIYHLPAMSAAQPVQLNGSLLAAIYSGRITRWNDAQIAAVNPGLTLPDLTIVPVRRSDSSGDTFLFTSYLSTQNQTWNVAIGYGTRAAWPRVSGELSEKGSAQVLQACHATLGCLAYNGISYQSQARADGLGEAKLANAAGQYTLPEAKTISASAGSFVSLTPVSETISMIDGPAAGGYPIVNYEYAVVSAKQPSAARAATLRAFLTWVITTGNGASYLRTVGFRPLSAALVSLGRTQVKEIGP